MKTARKKRTTKSDLHRACLRCLEGIHRDDEYVLVNAETHYNDGGVHTSNYQYHLPCYEESSAGQKNFIRRLMQAKVDAIRKRDKVK